MSIPEIPNVSNDNFMLSVVMMNVIMLSVVAPTKMLVTYTGVSSDSLMH
jgi:hypothetical protein